MNIDQALQLIELTEYQPVSLARHVLPNAMGEAIWQNYGRQIVVEFPSPKTAGQWRLTSQGWVGQIPLTGEYGLVLKPKTTLVNLFMMLEYAYQLDLSLLDGLSAFQSVSEFYARLALIFAQRVLDRSRKGLYRAYLPHQATLPYIRGRLDVTQAVRNPDHAKLACRYQDQSVDIDDNRILAWTLWCIARSGACTPQVMPAIRQAFRSLQRAVSLQPYSPEACLDRSYNRLNDDYQALHALCRFFLAQRGPGHQLGDYQMVPFLIDMANLYEKFVAEWLKKNLPLPWTIKSQESIDSSDIRAIIDLVLSNFDTGQIHYVLDTKYKTPQKPSNADIYQIVAYAKATRCREAILIYPTALAQPVDTMWDDIRVRSLTFALDGDIEQNGRRFLASLLH